MTGIAETKPSLIDIAIVKSYAYIQEYNPYTGRTEDKMGHTYLKEGYIQGFLDGVAHRLTGGNE